MPATAPVPHRQPMWRGGRQNQFRYRASAAHRRPPFLPRFAKEGSTRGGDIVAHLATRDLDPHDKSECICYIFVEQRNFLPEVLDMAMTFTCPNCGFKQGPTAKCRSCSTLFDYHYKVPPTATADDSQGPETAPPPGGILQRIFRRLKGPARSS